MGLKVGELYVTVSLDQAGFNRGLGGVAGAVQNVGKQIGAIGSQITSLGSNLTKSVTAPIVGLQAAIIHVGVDFDTTLRRIIALTDVTADEIGGIKQAILELSGETGKAPQELGEAFYFLASAGFNTKEALEVLKVAAKGSAAGLGDTQSLAKVAGAAVNAYGKENLTAAHAMDVLLRGVKDGTAESDEFAGALGDVLGSAAQMGVGIEDLTAGLSALTLKGINVNEAATSMNGIFVSLLKPTKQAEEAMKGMGLSSAGLRKQLKEEGLLATLQTLKEKFGDNDTAAASVFGNVRALRGVLGLLGGDAAQTAGVFKDLAGASGDIDQAFAETEGPGREMDRAMAEIQKTLIELGDTVIPAFVEALHHFQDIVQQVMEVWRSLSPEMQQGIVAFLAIAAVVGPVLVVLGSLFTVIGGLVTVFGLLLTPVGLVIAALVAGAVLIAMNWDTIGPIVGQVVDAIMGFVKTVADFLQPIIDNLVNVVFPQLIQTFNDIVAAVTPLVEDVLKAFGDVWNWISTEILPPVMQIIGVLTRDVFPALGEMIGMVVGFIRDHMDEFMAIIKVAVDFFINIFNAALPIIKAVINLIATVISAAVHVIADVFQFVAPIIMNVAKVVLGALLAAADALLPVFKTVFEAIANIVSTVAGIISTVISAAIDVFAGAIKTMGDVMTNLLKIVRSVWDAITSVIKGAINAVIGVINMFIDAINSVQIHIPGFDTPVGKVASFDWNGLNLPRIPKLAMGTGFFQGGLAVVGENGPELARLPKGAEVIGHSRSAGMMGQGGGPLIGEQHIYGVQPGDVERETRRAIRRATMEWGIEGR